MLMIIWGVTVVSLGLMVADYFWLQHLAKQRSEKRHHGSGETNTPNSIKPFVEPRQGENDE